MGNDGQSIFLTLDMVENATVAQKEAVRRCLHAEPRATGLRERIVHYDASNPRGLRGEVPFPPA
jgi:hypothetical protein